MRNVQRDGVRITFQINGGDRAMQWGVVAVILCSLVAALGLAWLGLTQESWVLALAPLLLMFPVLFGALRLLTSGRLARYALTIDRVEGTATARDQRAKQTLWSAPFEPARLYLAQTRVQVGYVSSLRDVLVYGDPVQDVVEDGVPTERISVLTIAPREQLEALMIELGARP